MIRVYADDTPVMRTLEEAPDRLIAGFLHGAEEEAAELAERIRENASGGVLHSYTGDLAESVQTTEPEISGIEASAGVVGAGGDAFYGRFLETGGDHPYQEVTRKGTQGVKKGGGALAFEVGGETIFARMIEHPPTPEKPWFFPVLDEMAPQIVEGINEALQESLAQ